MTKNRRVASPVVVGLVLLGAGLSAQTRPSSSAIEEIRLARSIRLSRVAPTEFCSQSRTTFADAQFEDRYSFAAVTTRSGDGLVIDALSHKLGSGHACFGRTADPGALSFYIEIDMVGIRSTGVGRCATVRSDFPESDIQLISCFANLGGFADPYIGGLLTTNTLTSRRGGAESDPPGYVQASIATVRLWKRRGTRSR